MDLPLTQSQRGTLKELCREIAGGSDKQEATVPSFRLKDEADAKTAALARAEAAEQRVKELEDKLEEALARRSWWRR
jgi:hypothetical protein